MPESTGIYMAFFNDLFKSMEARRKRTTMLILGGGCLMLLIISVVMVIVGVIFNAVETSRVNDLYGETLASICQPVPPGQESVDNFPDASVPRGVLLLTSDTQRRHAWHSELPAQWRADNGDEVVLVGCVEVVQTVIETCEYLRNSVGGEEPFTVRIRREQHETTLVLVNPQTARRIDSLTITGSEPDACPEDDGEFNSGEISGSEVTWDDFAGWIETYVFE